jgi:5-methylcytosine-specific restriction protein A
VTPSWRGRSSRHKRGYGTAWDKVRAIVLERDHHLCRPCLGNGHITEAREVDHILPKFKGGTDNPDNLQSICTDCHRTKTAAESAEAQGREAPKKQRRTIGSDGWPVDN